MRRWAVICASLAVIACAPREKSIDEMTVDDVIARNVEAIGGADAVAALANLRIHPEIVEPNFTVQGDYRATRGGKMRIDVFADGNRVFSEGIDTEGAWQQAGEGADIVAADDEARAALARGVDFNLAGLYDLESRGHHAALEPREMIAGTNYVVVRVTLADGFQRRYFINPESWLIERVREVRALHPDLDDEQRPNEIVESDYRAFCGVLRPTSERTIDLVTGEEIQHTTAHDVECNVVPETLDIARPG